MLYFRSLLRRLNFGYHIEYLMDSRKKQDFINLDMNSLHLYIDKMYKEPFREKQNMLILINTVRANRKQTKQVIEYIYKNIDKINSIITMVTFMTQIFLSNQQNELMNQQVAHRAFKMLQSNPHIPYNSYYEMKMIIFLQKCVGLHKFTNAQFMLIDFTRFKPLFICFTIELFFKNNLQNEYEIVNYLLDMFHKYENLVPFGDLHHLQYANKIITNEKFRQSVDRITLRVSHVVNKSNNSSTTQVQKQFPTKQQVLEQEYFNWKELYLQDLKYKYNL